MAHPRTLANSEIWAQWERNNPTSRKTIDHSAWNKFLKTYLVKERGINRIRYGDVTTRDKNYLYDYIWVLSKKPIHEYNRQEQLAYWINLYNASVVKMILEHYPVDSINDINISPGLFRDGPWDAHRIRVNHVTLSLNDIRNHIVLPNWNDHRVLYALSNGTIGSPELQDQAFSSKNLEAMLEKASINFINSPRTVQVIDNKLITSVLYHDYLDNFGGTQDHIIQHLTEFARPELKAKLKNFHHITRFTTNLHVNDSVKRRG